MIDQVMLLSVGTGVKLEYVDVADREPSDVNL